jgi:hypothetical protein
MENSVCSIIMTRSIGVSLVHSELLTYHSSEYGRSFINRGDISRTRKDNINENALLRDKCSSQLARSDAKAEFENNNG